MMMMMIIGHEYEMGMVQREINGQGQRERQGYWRVG
jgi:hypothetical protein